jgi:hypothetical protein
MFSRVLTIAAVAVYLLVMGCVLIPGGTTANTPGQASAASGDPATGGGPRAKLTGMPLRGVAMTIHNVDDPKPYLKCIDEIAEVGADTVEIIVASRQENGSSTTIWVDQRYTPSKAQLLDLIGYAKKKNLRVVIMPIVLIQSPRGKEWRGTIKPDSWEAWFDNYRVMLRYFAQVCEEGKADVLVVGSELVSTETKGAEWQKVIKMARAQFPSGMLTYSANWDHYANIPFWEQLDFIGMNSYWKLGENGENNQVAVPEIVSRWKAIQKELVAFSTAKKKPIVLLEVGWCSLSNAAHEPWDYTRTDQQTDWDLQRRLYDGFFQSWHGNPHLGGFMVWEWLPTGDIIEKDDKTYIPKGKPAYDVLKTWMGKPAWQVK